MSFSRIFAFTVISFCIVGLVLVASGALPSSAALGGVIMASVVYNSTLKTNRMQLVIDKTDSKTAAASTGSALAGKIVIGTSALSGATGVLATIALPTPSFVESGGVITLQGVPLSAVATGSGTAAKAEIRNNADATVVSGLTVGTSGTDIIIDSVSITSGETVSITSGTVTHG